jgi:uroporphyrinogen III methyltransferase/synthase
MGVTTVEHWSTALIGAGKPGQTPVAIVRRASLPDQRRVVTSLSEVAAVVKQSRLRPPAVFIVGDVARLGEAIPWFEQRPLFGQKVLVTRARDQADTLCRPLAELGAEVLVQPAIEIRPPRDWSAVDAALGRLAEFDWIVFSSSNGVRFFLDRLLTAGRDLRALGKSRLAAVGPGTADELARYHLRADLVPDQFDAESLAASLVNTLERSGSNPARVLLVRASRGRDVLARELAEAGVLVEQVVAYESVDVTALPPELREQMAAGQIAWTTETSSAIARSLVHLFGELLDRTRLVSISPLTSETLRELGFPPAVEAQDYTMAGLIQAIRQASANPPPRPSP